MRALHPRSLVLGLAAAVLVAGCGAGGELLMPGGPAYRCAGLPIDPDDLATAPAASELGPEGRAALDGLEVPDIDVEAGWLVLEESSDRVTLLRELAEPLDLGDGVVHTHDVLAVQRITGATNVEDGAWVLDLFGTCDLRLEGDAGVPGDADLALATAPDPASTTVELLVTERECASGQSAEGRIELLELEESAEQVLVRIGVRGLEGDQNCPSNPPTPFTIELDGPLGDRAVVDGSTVPPRELVVGQLETEVVEDVVVGVDDATIERALSWQPPSSYVLLLETVCFCPTNLYEVRVEAGEVVARSAVDEDGAVLGDADAALAPSLTELLDRIRRAATTDEEGVLTELTIDPATDALRYVGFDPLPNAVDDEIGFQVQRLLVDGA